ncbi:MAG: Outer membrane protein assembly factor BamB [candidate division BRC1 bacterium ADurb.BinA364]|nr:MAG: Outer membrane protein assembly factor BamB [candidate division BRC1 bacterium ADurb.BinA364]
MRESPEAYTTPIPFERPGGAEILVSGGDYITAHDPETGEERWRFHYNPNKHPAYRQVVSPLAFGDIVVCVQPRHTTVFAFRAPQSGSHSFDEALWVYGGAVPDVVAPLHYRGRLYVMHGVQGKLACLEPETGKEIWQQDLGVKNKFYASPSAADGRLYLINIDGEAITIEAGDEYKELCRVSLGGRAVTGSIAIADNKLFIRGDDRLLCIGAK